MELTKDDFFHVTYNPYEDVIEVGKYSTKQKIQKFIMRHRVITCMIIALVLAMVIDIVYIVKFFALLGTL